jgi:hypothetical protein
VPMKQDYTLNQRTQDIIVGTTTTNDMGEWELEVPIFKPGQYSFRVYENFGEENQVASEIDTTIELTFKNTNKNTDLHIGPNPYNPTEGPLTIETVVGKSEIINIGIYTISGQKVYGISGFNQTIGSTHHFWNGRWNGQLISPGLYIVIMEISGETKTVKTKRLGVKW